jgi:hypothetical protein
VTRVLKIVVFLAVFFAALLIGHQNATAAFRSYELEAKLPTRVPVFCTDNIHGPAYALIYQREIYLDSTDCQSLLHATPSWTDGHGGQSWALHAHTLLHEWVHVAFQSYDEKRVECIAYGAYRYWLGAYWGLNAAKAQAFYAATTTYSAYAPLGCVL